MNGNVKVPYPAPKVILCVTDSLFKGYTPPPWTDTPYIIWSMHGQRSNLGRGFTGDDPAIRFTGDRYTTHSVTNGSGGRSHVYPGDTLSGAITDFNSMVSGMILTPTDIILEHGLNDIAAGASASTTIARCVTYWGLVAAQWPTAKKWQVVHWVHSGQPQSRQDYQDSLIAGQAGADVCLIDWRDFPLNAFTNDATGIHQNVPANPTLWTTWNDTQDYQNDITWGARRILESLYGTHNGGTFATVRTLNNLAGETFP